MTRGRGDPRSWIADPARLSVLRVLAVSLVLGVHASLVALYWGGGAKELWGDEKRYLASAYAFLGGDPSWWPEPLWPPLSSQFLAGVLAVGGGLVAVHCVQTFLLCVVAVVLGDLTRRWTGSRTAGTAAAILVLTYPPLVAFAHYLWPEVLHLVLGLIAVWALAVRRGSWVWCGIAGVTLGLALLTKSLLGPFLPVLIVAAFWGDQQPRRMLRIGICVISVGLTVAPVLWAQKQRIGSAMIADSSAFNLWVGLNDKGMKSFEDEYVARAYSEFQGVGGSFLQRNQFLRERCIDFVRTRGVGRVLRDQLRRQYFRFFDKDSYLTEQLPGGAAIPQKAGYVGVGPTWASLIRKACYGSYALILLTAPLGYLAWSFQDKRWVRVMVLFLAYNLVLFLFLHVKSRYRIQILPVAFLGTAAAVAWTRDRIELGFAGQSIVRLLTAGLLAALLLALAFTGGL